ncbi:hypothetical protein AVEN_190067-1 [Araneus ventricosus]|uniref:Uncharacterized protein n=1 Tax=Araneus ventricosus TaxID=182803 RepID=A0A4Y2PFD3_ARAVE|nr:hypothetical protein AVEN_244155-1 [Araneus ventricosus]GBN49921.1 hypothetical protein AVEN_190067-1 [Araneus ventricosus]
MKPRHLNCLAHFGDPPDGSVDVRESVYMYIYKEKIVREHLTGPQHYPDNGLVSGTRGEVSRNQEEEEATADIIKDIQKMQYDSQKYPSKLYIVLYHIVVSSVNPV